MATEIWLDFIMAVGSILTPLLLLILTGVGWKYRQSIERKSKIEEKLRDDRIEIYNSILEPFIILFMTEEAWKTDKKYRNINKHKHVNNILLSLEYRKMSFKLSLIGSDDVVLCFNNLMQFFFNTEDLLNDDTALENTKKMMFHIGNLLLEIRKSMGNESTRIDNWGMLEWFFVDARKLREEI